MTPERWRKMEDLFDAAAQLPPAERTSFLSAECADDDDLRSDVEALLGAGDRADGFLERPALELGADLPAAIVDGGLIPDPLVGIEVGAYRVVRRIGTGGMGVVYLAEQRNPARTVALKLIRPGIATEKVMRRFEHEAQILGRLHHPGIASIYEAGTAVTPLGAQPFFAMEYIVGEPLLDFARRRSLTLRERLVLLIRICDAVHHAHSKGVVHRDLKPGNILVEDRDANDGPPPPHDASAAPSTLPLIAEQAGRPRILDFGVARVIDPDAPVSTSSTEVGEVLGTIAYMSPEQIAPPTGADSVDTRSDVFSLGVVAFHLLAGRLPCEVSGLPIHEAARVVCLSPPARPSSIDRALRGDIETVMLKSLEKAPSHRYQSAAAFAEDLRRVLLDQPVLARPPSTAYQLRKLVARHKAPFAALTAFFLAVCAFSAWMSMLYARADRLRRDAETAWGEQRTARVEAESNERRAEEAERLAVRRADTASRVVNVLTDAFQALDPTDTASADVNARDIVAHEIVDRGIRKIQAELGDEPTVRAHLLYHLGMTCGGLGQYDRAVALIREAIDTRRGALDAPDLELGTYLKTLALNLKLMGRADEARDAMLEGLRIFRALLPESSPYIADSLNTLALIYVDQGKIDEAEHLYLESASLHQKTSGHERSLTAQSLNNLAGALVERGEYARAETIVRRCIELGGNGDDAGFGAVTAYRHNLSWVLCLLGRYDEAESLVRQVMATRRAQFPEGHDRTTPEMLTLGLILTRTGRAAEAEPYLRRCLSIRESATPGNVISIGEARSALGECIAEIGRNDEAESLLLASQRALQAESQPWLEAPQMAMARLVRFYERQGREDDAAPFRSLLRPPWDRR